MSVIPAIISTNQINLQRSSSFATRTMIRHTYELIGHPGREHIIAKVRLKFWISQIGMLLCSVLSRCIVCNKFHSKPITQQMIPLLTSRMSHSIPSLEWTFLSPLDVKLKGSTVKRWWCLFPFLNTRAILLELAHSVVIQDFIMCFTMFKNRRGKVVQLRCDRSGTTQPTRPSANHPFSLHNAQKDCLLTPRFF